MSDSEVKSNGIVISATQIGLVELCERKYFFERVLGLKPPPTKGMLLGSEVHKLSEAWLKTSTTPPATKPGMILRAGLSHLPPPGTPGMTVEREFRMGLGEGLSLIGFEDVFVAGDDGGIWDLKTTRDFKWVKTPAQLKADIQAQIYGLDWLWANGGSAAAMEWVYFRTEGAPKAESVPFVITRTEGEAGYERAMRAGDRIKALKVLTEAKDVLPSPDACGAFGGCPHRSYCDVGKQTWSSMFGKSTQPKEESCMSRELQEKLAKMREEAAAGVAKFKTPEGQAEIKAALPLISVNPPDAAKSPDDLPPPLETKTETKPKAKRGRPAKVQVAPESTPVSADGLLGATNAVEEKAILDAVTGISEPMEVPRLEPKRETKKETSLFLWIDALPVKFGSSVSSLDSLLQSAAKKVAAQHGDWRLVDYGKGAALFLLAFAEVYEEAFKDFYAKGGASVITIDSRQAEAQIVLSWLIDRANIVIRGIR